MPEGSNPELPIPGNKDMTIERTPFSTLIPEGITPHDQNVVNRAVKQVIGKREFLPISGGAGFLYDNPSELGLVANPELRRIVFAAETMLATASGKIAISGLEKVHGKITDMVLDGKVDPVEAQQFLRKIQDRSKLLEGLSQGNSPSNRASGEAVVEDNNAIASALDRLRDLQEQLFKRGIDQRQVDQQIQPDVNQLVELFGRSNPEKERERWSQQEYNQDFYARFQPNQEPGFYSRLEPGEREVYDARWQLARAAFIKRMQSSNVKEMIGNQELGNLKSEQMEILYDIPGVKPALEWYAEFIANNKTIKAKDSKGQEKDLSIWGCRSKSDFEQIRHEMRKQALGNLEGPVVKFGGNGGEVLGKIEADAIAWNIIYCSNLLESLNSRYAKSGSRDGDMPGFLISDDLRAVFHTQEKFEDKVAGGQDWGVFGKWGMSQMNRIRAEVGRSPRDYVIKFVPARNENEFWSHKVLNSAGVNSRGEKLKDEVVVSVPECCPTITTISFLERWSNGDFDDKSSLLQKLIKKEVVDWSSVPSDAWAIYNFVNVNKAFKLSSFFSEGVPLDIAKGNEREWTREILDCITRLKLQDYLTNDQVHNLKVWAVYGGLGGMDKPNSLYPTMRKLVYDKRMMTISLRKASVGYLEESNIFGPFAGESLDLRY